MVCFKKTIEQRERDSVFRNFGEGQTTYESYSNTDLFCEKLHTQGPAAKNVPEKEDREVPRLVHEPENNLAHLILVI